MEMSTLLMALGVVLQWTRFQVAMALTLMPLRPNLSCFYTIEMDEEVTAFLSFGYPLTLGFSFAIGQYITLQLTLPPQIEKAKFLEFNNYLEKTGMTRCYLKAMELMIEEEIEDDEDAYLLLQKACGGPGEIDTVDTTNIMSEISACKDRIEAAKEQLKEAMLKYMDAIERSTSDDVFIETELSKRRRKPYNRASCLLMQFGCKTRVRHIKRLREERGIVPTPVTAAQLRYQRRVKYLTDSELSFIKNDKKPPDTVVEAEEEFLEPEEHLIVEEEEEFENALEQLISDNETTVATEN